MTRQTKIDLIPIGILIILTILSQWYPVFVTIHGICLGAYFIYILFDEYISRQRKRDEEDDDYTE